MAVEASRTHTGSSSSRLSDPLGWRAHRLLAASPKSDQEQMTGLQRRYWPFAQRQIAVDRQQEQQQLQSPGERTALLERKRLQAIEDRLQ